MEQLPISPVETPPVTVLPPARPRIWTVFVALTLSLVAAGILQGIGMVVWAIATGVNLQELQSELPEMLKTPTGFLLLAGLGQMAFALTVLMAASLSPQPFRLRLGFVRTGLSSWTYVALMVGSLIPLAIGVGIGQVLANTAKFAEFTEVDKLAGTMYEQMTPSLAVLFILFIAIVPAFTEEAMYRGYVQRRLLERWSPVVAITIVGLIFAAMHGTVQWAVQVFPLGMWLGIVAWRTDSIWPGIACHAFVNGSRNLWGIVAEFAEIPAKPQLIALAALGPVALAFFVVALRALVKQCGTRPLQVMSEPVAPTR